MQKAGHSTQETADRAAHGTHGSAHTPGNVAQEKIDQVTIDFSSVPQHSKSTANANAKWERGSRPIANSSIEVELIVRTI